ncbi:hypothetical protein TNCV_317491 [Trichonephila clavipes]|nr:hypothetical protein TNCV_317491 [Trichonephila clavipes]
MEQSDKNITNADKLTSKRERNLAKENGEIQQANINDENEQDLDDPQPSEKYIVQTEDISNTPTEKYLENVGSKVFGYKRGLAFRGTEEVLGSPHNGNFMGALKLLFIREHIEQREFRSKSLI